MFAPLARWRTWRLKSITRHRLARMDDRMLADIGTERDAIDDFVAAQGDGR